MEEPASSNVSQQHQVEVVVEDGGGMRRSGSGKAVARQASTNSSNSLNSSVNSSMGLTEFKKKLKRAPKSTAEAGQDQNGVLGSLEEESDSGGTARDPEHELHVQLYEPLRECSRQRLRAIQMGLRKFANVESRITAKELSTVMQENHIKLSSRAFQLLVDSFEDAFGIDYEKLWKSLVTAQAKTGRDSVLAHNRRNEVDSGRPLMTQEQKDADLLRRLELQLAKAGEVYNVAPLRQALQARDKNKAGKLDKQDVLSICSEKQLSVYGALLSSLINRCDDEQNGQINWPEVLSFIERAQQSLAQGMTHTESTGNVTRPTTAAVSEPRPGTTPGTAKSSAKPQRGRGRGQGRATAGRKPGARAQPSPRPSTRGKSAGGRGRGKAVATDVKQTGGVNDSVVINVQEDSEEDPDPPVIPEEASTAAEDNKPFAQELLKGAIKKANDSQPETSNDPKKANALARARKFFIKRESNNSLDDAEFKKTAGTLKTSSGILTSMKSFLADCVGDDNQSTAEGRKKEGEDEDTSVPLIQVDKDGTSNLTADKTKSPRPGGTRNGASPRSGLKAIDMHIKGKTVTLWPPDDYKDSDVNTDPPQQRLKLQWAYGYRGNDCRSNLYVIATGEIIYFIGTVVVIYDRKLHVQRHYREHTQEIRSLAVHPNKITVATGQGVNKGTSAKQAKGQACIRLWRADNLQTLHILGSDVLINSVVCLAFSKSKERLCAVDTSEGHSLSVWDIGDGSLIAQTKLDVEMMCDVDFNPTNSDVIVTIGKEHQAWWNVLPEQGAVQMQYKADFGTYLRAKYVICLLHNEKGDLVTGDSNGTVYVWANSGNTITNFIKHSHEGPVFSMKLTRGSLLTSGRDGMVCSWIWSKNMDKAGQLAIPRHEGGVRMLQVHEDHLMMGTTTNSILLAPLGATALRNPLAGAQLLPTPLTQGHFDSAEGIAIMAGSRIVTAGADGVVSMIDTHTKKPLWKLLLKNTIGVSIDVDEEATMVAIATRDSVVILDVIHDDEEHQFVYGNEMGRINIGEARLTTIKLSPDAATIAVGDIKGNIHIVCLRETDEGDTYWQASGQCQGHMGAINALDWSKQPFGNSHVLRSTSESIELIYWDVVSLSRLTGAEQFRNLSWATNHCLLGSGMAGVWHSKKAKEADITAVDINPQRTLVVMGDSSGYVSVFRHPCTKQGAYSHTYKSHPRVRSAVFSGDGSKVLTVGGPDSVVMQWTVV